jgi:hypothetical protein
MAVVVVGQVPVRLLVLERMAELAVFQELDHLPLRVNQLAVVALVATKMVHRVLRVALELSWLNTPVHSRQIQLMSGSASLIPGLIP